MLFKITNGAVYLGGEAVLENINFEINAGEKIAVVGRNGAGKSTLLKCITGEVTAQEGPGEGSFCVAKTGNPIIGYLEQISFAGENSTLLDEVLKAFEPLLKTEARLEELHQSMENDPTDEVIREYTSLAERFELMGGYTYKKEYSVMIRKFGFSEDDKHKAVNEFSGGQRTKIAFMKLLLSHPDILLLDEPTNHLDIETVEWLEKYLQTYRSAAVIVSHDRMFLENIADKVYEIEYGETHRYKGTYSDFERQKKENYQKQLKDYEYRRKERERLTRLVERFRYKATKASMAQSKLKLLERMGEPDTPDRYDLKRFHTDFQPETESVKRVLDVQGLCVGYKKTLANVTFELERGRKLGVIGANGSGKTTFIKTLMGEVKPISGSFTFGEKVIVGYFDQQMAHFKSSKTVKDEFHDDFPELTETQVRNALGSFLFSGDDVFKRVDDLSGGERVRLALCKIFKRRPNVLILDEPTNHMDIVGKETLEDMLCVYEGTLIIVSHDRYLINKVADRLLVFGGEEAHFYNCRYEELEERNSDYRGSVSDGDSPFVSGLTQRDCPRTDTLPSAQESSGKETYAALKEKSRKEKRIKKLEELMEEGDARIKTLEAQLQGPDISSDYEKLSELQQEIDEVKAQQEIYTEEWMELSE